MARSRTAAARQPRETVAAVSPAADTLTEQAYRLIEEQIVTLNLKPGDVLSEQLLSATLKIGRTPIREALQRLAREGLVTILPRKGILVLLRSASFTARRCSRSGFGFLQVRLFM